MRRKYTEREPKLHRKVDKITENQNYNLKKKCMIEKEKKKRIKLFPSIFNLISSCIFSFPEIRLQYQFKE